MRDLLPQKISQIIPMYEQALLELFTLHKDELIKLAKLDDWVDGISFEMIPNAYQNYSAISFRQGNDYKNYESLKYSPADWVHYSLLDYKTSKSEKFKEVSEFIFQLYEEIENKTEKYDKLQMDINHLIFIAVAEAVLQPTVAEKLREFGFHASVITNTPDSYTFEYIVSDADKHFNFNYCDLIVANRMTNEVLKKLKI